MEEAKKESKSEGKKGGKILTGGCERRPEGRYPGCGLDRMEDLGK